MSVVEGRGREAIGRGGLRVLRCSLQAIHLKHPLGFSFPPHLDILDRLPFREGRRRARARRASSRRSDGGGGGGRGRVVVSSGCGRHNAPYAGQGPAQGKHASSALPGVGGKKRRGEGEKAGESGAPTGQKNACAPTAPLAALSFFLTSQLRPGAASGAFVVWMRMSPAWLAPRRRWACESRSWGLEKEEGGAGPL